VPPRATQARLRELFRRWGLPERLRVDNGMPWGSQGDLPTDLACWLAGLGVGVVPNPPRRPQDNGVVERSQGVGKAWGEPQSCTAAAQLEARLEELDRWQRELYPLRNGLSRRETYPQLRHSGRPYTPAWESRNWDVRRVWAMLESYVVPRRVDRQGKVSLYGWPYHVGILWSGRTIWVGFEAGSWVFQDESGHEITRRPAAELTAERIQALDVTHRRRGIHAAKPHARSQTAKPRSRSRAAKPTSR
jgi:hypothetical protein